MARVKGVVLSVAAPKVADLGKVVRAVKVGMAKAKTAIKVKKYIMASPLLLRPPLKALEMDLKGMRQKAENPLIRAPESPALLAKASDF